MSRDSKKIKLKDIHAVQDSICLTNLLQNYDVHSKCFKKNYIMELIELQYQHDISIST